MAAVTPLQERRVARGTRARPARITALVACALLLLTVLGALRHETSVAHVRDAVSGQLRHAHALAEHHTTSDTAHVHGRDVAADAEAGGCELLAALDHAAILPSPAGAVADSTPLAVADAMAVTDAPDPRSRYRLAPKTSPPARV